MVEGVKTIAIEFTLTSAAVSKMFNTGARNEESFRFRVIIDDNSIVSFFWRTRNALAEDVWISDERGSPHLAGIMMDRSVVNAIMIGHMAGMLGTHRGIAVAAGAKELPNGATIFDLGTI
jgi:hypothetical protein